MSTTLKPQDVLKMLREARKMPKNSSIISKFDQLDAFLFPLATYPAPAHLSHHPPVVSKKTDTRDQTFAVGRLRFPG